VPSSTVDVEVISTLKNPSALRGGTPRQVGHCRRTPGSVEVRVAVSYPSVTRQTYPPTALVLRSASAEGGACRRGSEVFLIYKGPVVARA
jgi:hypothetical protein